MSKKLTERLAVLSVCVLMAAASCLAAFAVGPTITIKECDNLQLTLPDNMTAVTRSSDESDPYFAQHKLSYQAVMNALNKGDCYLQAMDDKNELTLTLSYLDTDATDFTELTNEELAEMSRSFLGGTDSEVQFNACTPDQAKTDTNSDSLVWLMLNMSALDQTGKMTTQFQATTVYSGKNITVTLYRNGGDVIADDYPVLESVVRTVKANRAFPWRRLRPFLYIFGGIALIIVIIIAVRFIVKKVKSSERGHKTTENDKILKELAGKYQLRPRTVVYVDDDKSKDKDAADKTGEAAKDDAKKDGGKADEKAEEFVDIYANSTARRNAAASADAKKTEMPEQTEKPAAAATSEQAEKPAATEKPEQTEKPAAAAPEKPAEPAEQEEKEDRPPRLTRTLKQPETARRHYDDDDLDDEYDGDDTPVRKYSDEDIERLLAD